MAASAKIQRTDLLEAQERHGAIVRLVMRSRVVDLTDTTYETLMTALDVSGIPAAGSTLTGAPNLILTERNPKLVNKGVVDVDLVYEHFMNEGQDLDTPLGGLSTGRISANVQQVTSNLDGDDVPITVEHTYPATDPDWPGETKTQGGEIQYYQPQRTIFLQGIKDTFRPWVIANSIIGKVNSTTWSGEGRHEWMCTNVTWTLYDRDTQNRYLMTFEFQHNPDSWNPTAVFIDERTGRPPVDLVEDEGYKYIRKHDAINFERVIGTRIQGG